MNDTKLDDYSGPGSWLPRPDCYSQERANRVRFFTQMGIWLVLLGNVFAVGLIYCVADVPLLAVLCGAGLLFVGSLLLTLIVVCAVWSSM